MWPSRHGGVEWIDEKASSSASVSASVAGGRRGRLSRLPMVGVCQGAWQVCVGGALSGGDPEEEENVVEEDSCIDTVSLF